MASKVPLKTYKGKRDFKVTPEPRTGGMANESKRSFVIQKHWASRLHYDFRLELDGYMKSWAVPKGPSLDPGEKRMAIQVEDHPISYNTFEGKIPAMQYGAGEVIIWDKGYWIPVGDPYLAYEDGHLKFELHGHKLEGKWVLVRMNTKREKQPPWLLIKEKDEFARSHTEYRIVEALPDSVAEKKLPEKTLVAKGSPVEKNTSRKSSKEGWRADAKKSGLPTQFKPQLATLVAAPPPDSAEWQYEIKFDGYRLMARIEANTVRLFTRNGNDWSGKLSALVAAIKKLRLPPAWLDGEIVVLNDSGIPDFQALQGAFDHALTENIIFYVFDLPFYNGFDLTAVPLGERRTLLKTIIGKSDDALIRFSNAFDAPQGDLLASACRLGLEGVIGKKKTSLYVSRRSHDWIKLKCTQRQEFVIGGYTDPQGKRLGIGSLLLGVYDESGKLHYAGNVGTGFNRTSLEDIKKKLDGLASPQNPFMETKLGTRQKAHWVVPRLVAEVSFGEWTRAGRVRHAVFHGVRADKKAKSVFREKPAHLQGAQKTNELPKTFKVSHPDRVVDTSIKVTKLDVIQYYFLIAPLMMEHLKGRPVSLVRAPEGIAGPFFFQKHIDKVNMPGIKQLASELNPGHAPLLEVYRPAGLLAAAQMNVLEFHTWNATKTNILKPDRMTFDLDPGAGVAWTEIRDSAQLVREFLSQLGLVSFIKTSGGKGLHIVVPIHRLYGWEAVKDFSQAIVKHLAGTLPQRFTAKSGPRNRVGKIFIDYLRNGFGATTVAAWSVRSRPGLGISIPIQWSELDSVTGSAQWNISNIQDRLEVGNSPWKDYRSSAQGLSSSMKILGFRPLKKGS
ncbi:MAG: DNA ligase D [Pseudomonadota bacterium]